MELKKAEENRKKSLEKRLIEKSSMTCNIRQALDDYMGQRRELKNMKKQE